MRRRAPRNSSTTSIVSPSASLTIDRYIDGVQDATRAGDNSEDVRTIRMLAHSNGSRLTKAIWPRLRYLRDNGVKVVAVFTKFRSKKQEQATLNEYADVFGADAVLRNVRIAKLREADRLKEHLVLGKRGVWHDDGRNAPTSDGSVTATETKATDPRFSAARVSFNMVWAVSDQVLPKETISKDIRPKVRRTR